MFIGQFLHTMDPKGRVSIPAEFRMEFQRHGEMPPILITIEDHLALYPNEEWRKLADKVLSSPLLSPEVTDLEDYLFPGAHACPIDKQGRIAIPAVSREEAQLEREVVIAGSGKRVTIWNTERYQKHRTGLHKHVKQLLSTVSRMDRES